MTTKQQRRSLPWSFMVGDTRIDVQCGSGHWSDTFNIKTGEFGKTIYVYEATITEPDGKRRNAAVPRSYFNQLRRYADDPESNVKAV